MKTALADRYTVGGEVGSGGMAIVYLAEDLKHRRKVALKVLRPELTAELGSDRFLREIELAASLTHPHILPLHDSGEANGFLYYVMPFVEGESLRDRLVRERQLPIDEALQITREVADALDYAHSENVVHRDIKPENIMVFRGHAMVMDFGIGKALHAAGAEHLTQTGVAVGTPAYMSPEQAAGDRELDGRSDLYSLGCVLYEMLAGEQPFTGPTAQAIIAGHITEEAPSIVSKRGTVPDAIDQVLRKALAKTPADRFSTGTQFAEALAPAVTKPVPHVSATAAARPQPADKSIAVLPFANMSADPENEYFSDGITEEIINALTQLPDLHVAARTSAFSFKGKSEDLRTVGEKLNVSTVLEGSVRKVGNRLRITAQLVNVCDGYHLWSERYDREMDDVFAIQDEIATAIADRLKVTVVGDADDPLVRPPTDNLDAYDRYLKGRFFLYQRVGASFQNALECFERARVLDPEFALAHAGLADAYGLIGFYGLRPPKDAMSKARAEALRALELDATLAEAHNALGFVHLVYDWDWSAGKREIQTALELNPKYVQARLWYAFLYLLMVEGDFDAAVAEGWRAHDLDPLASYPKGMLGLILTVAGQYDTAIEQIKAAICIEPNSFLAYRCLGLAYSWQGRYQEAVAALERTAELSGRHQWAVGELLAAYAAWGKSAEAKALYDELLVRSGREYVQNGILSIGEAWLGSLDAAFQLLDRAFDERDTTLVVLKVWPGYEPFRKDPRFDELLTRLNLK